MKEKRRCTGFLDEVPHHLQVPPESSDYEFFWIAQGRGRLTAYKSFMVNNVADPHKTPGDDTGVNERGKLANTLAMFRRCVSEDGLVMIAALLRGKKIEGLGVGVRHFTAVPGPLHPEHGRSGDFISQESS
uniref:Uncharacterized protein n=1 Tax=Lotharella oceanica TaxID=641309 RepID=A0A7S2XHN1_9EUKA